MPCVSVIIPIYNAEQYLRPCIDSILAQTFGDFELLLIDDGSRDGSGAICDAFAAADPRIAVIHKQNGGVAAARNSGLDAAKGRYIAFCDSDDAWRADLLGKAVSALECETCDAVIFNADWIRSAEDHRKTSFRSGVFDLSSPEKRFEYLMTVYFPYKHGFEVWNRLFRAELIQAKGLRFCTNCKNYAEDMGFLAKYALYADKLVCIPDVLYDYHVVENSITRQTNRLRIREHNASALDFERQCARIDPPMWNADRLACIWFMFLLPQLKLLLQRGQADRLRDELSEVEDPAHLRDSLKRVLRQKKTIKACCDDLALEDVFCLCRYALHQSWLRYRIERKLLIK